MAFETTDGYIRARARISRTGIQEYLVGELRKAGATISDSIPDSAIARIYRSPEVVFDEKSLLSISLIPMTVTHPDNPVNPSSVSSVFSGVTFGDFTRDGDGKHVVGDVQIMSSAGIAAYNNGMRQLSLGYRAPIVMKAGYNDEVGPYDGFQAEITGNHLAQVVQGRAGTAQFIDEDKMSKELEEKIKQLEAQLSDSNSKNAEFQGKLAAMQSNQLTDAQLDEKAQQIAVNMLQQRKDRAELVDHAKKVAPQLAIGDSMSDFDIMKLAIATQRPDVNFDSVGAGMKPNEQEIARKAFAEGIFRSLAVADSGQNNQQSTTIHRDAGVLGYPALNKVLWS